MKIKETALFAICSAIIFASQVGLAFLPNVEMVSLLFVIYAINFGRKSFFIVYTFVFLEGLMWGFGFWWIMYLYIWDIIVVIALIFRNRKSPLFWAVVSGFYGLFFGALCTLPFLFTGLFGENGSLLKGLNLMLSYWITGIPFDITHCAGNFVMALVLFKPLNYIVSFSKAKFLGEVN